MTTSRKARIVIDPNVYASVLLGGITRQRFIWLLDQLHRFEICYSEAVLKEIRHLPEITYFKKKQITSEIVIEFIEGLQQLGLQVVVTSKVKLGRDVNDYFLLSLSRDARANFLITGDPDLIEMKNYSSTEIVSLKNFKERFE
jgi:putative PIN family toxin of toxin-antitoxin system